MTDLRKAAEMALETLEMTVPYLPAKTATLSEVEETITELRQALAQPEQKPECIGVIGNWGRVEWSNGVFPQLGDRLYTAPPKREWVGLTEDEFEGVLELNNEAFPFAMYQQLEAKLKEKNNG